MCFYNFRLMFKQNFHKMIFYIRSILLHINYLRTFSSYFTFNRICISALKHYTSKLRQFSDLESVETLGFRGEALSALCALCDVEITTRHGSAEYAFKLKYDHNGKIQSESIIARTIGTTVSLTNLFNTLPVRRKEFVKNMKKEFNKMCQLLYAYCLVSTGVK